jgi:hypothetical protein
MFSVRVTCCDDSFVPYKESGVVFWLIRKGEANAQKITGYFSPVSRKTFQCKSQQWPILSTKSRYNRNFYLICSKNENKNFVKNFRFWITEVKMFKWPLLELF